MSSVVFTFTLSYQMMMGTIKRNLDFIADAEMNISGQPFQLIIKSKESISNSDFI